MELFYFSLPYNWLWLMKILSSEYFQWKACPEIICNHNILLIWFFLQLMQLQFTVTGFSRIKSNLSVMLFIIRVAVVDVITIRISYTFLWRYTFPISLVTTSYLEEVNTKAKWNDGTIPPTLLPPTCGSSTVWMILENGNIPDWWTVTYQCLLLSAL